MRVNLTPAAMIGAAVLSTALLFGLAAKAPAAPPVVAKARAAAKSTIAPLGPNVTPLPTSGTPAATTPHTLEATDVNAWLDGYMPYAIKSGDIGGAVVV